MVKRKRELSKKEELELEIEENIKNIKSCVQNKKLIYDEYVSISNIHNMNLIEFKKDEKNNSGKLRIEYNKCYELLKNYGDKISSLNKSHYKSVDTISKLNQQINLINK